MTTREAPLDFGDEMVRAIFAGTKTQMRLPVTGSLTTIFADLASGALRKRCHLQAGDRFLVCAASGLMAEVTDVRVALLWSTSVEDALAEGVDSSAWHGASLCGDSPVGAFCELWDRTNGERAPWDTNPWVWVVSFKRVEVTNDNA